MLRDVNQGPATPAERWTVIIMVAGMFVLAGLEIFLNHEPGKAVIFFFCLFWIPLIALHELGHAWMAALLGWNVYAVVVGVGRQMGSFRVGRLRVQWHLIPLSGYAQIGPRSGTGEGWRGALTYFAGPGIELLLFVGLLLGFGWEELTTKSNSIGLMMVQGLAFAALVGAVTNLIPQRIPQGGQWIDNDGMGIWRCLFRRT